MPIPGASASPLRRCWPSSPSLLIPTGSDGRSSRCSTARRQALISEANELLFLWVVVALDGEQSVDPVEVRRAATICDAAIAFASPVEPWRALRHRCETVLGGNPHPSPHASPAGETSARACFQWALICDLDGRTQDAVAWLERATLLEPDDYWSQFYLGYYLGREGQKGRALEHYQAAVALRPDSPWARMNRAYSIRRGATGLGRSTTSTASWSRLRGAGC